MRLRARLIAGLRQRGVSASAATLRPPGSPRRALSSLKALETTVRPVQSAIICSRSPRLRRRRSIQLAALRITLQRIDNGEGRAFKHRALQFGAGGVRANAEKAGPRVRAVKRRTFAIEVRLPEDAAAAGSTAAIACSGCPRSASSEICCCSQSMFGVPACIGNRRSPVRLRYG